MRTRSALSLSLVALLTGLSLLLVGCGMPGTVPSGGSLPHVAAAPSPTPLPPIQFPQDEAPHHNLTEWWYYTGHLHGTDVSGAQHMYGFELTFFQTLRGQFSPYYAAHFAISDITRQQFHYDQRAGFAPLSVIPPPGSTGGFNVSLDGWSAQGLNGHDTLKAAMDGYSITLQLSSDKPAALHGGNGLITYGSGGFSYYYSRPLMHVSGTVQDAGVQVAVTGQAWMDHQWGNFVSLAGAGWDWFSIQLANDTQYMFYIIRDADKRPLSVVGTAIGADGSASEIPATEITITALGSWTSPHTGGVYPSGWRVVVPSHQLTLTLTPLLLDQELITTQSTGVAYWEGAVGIIGTAQEKAISGEGYVELTGYAALPSGSASAAVP
ncbi:MAG: AttH component of AttEFGH ABC transport system [Ktedonobacterales bacterium]|jgi:predicted secreted hydrolase|nr:MAG: AttH component of AttEFGH ABC transport system [Ktedonobacterales bacterium]